MIPIAAGARIWTATGHTVMRKACRSALPVWEAASGSISIPELPRAIEYLQFKRVNIAAGLP